MDAESRWNVTEKECYAIVYALKRLEHLLRNIHFVLRTDHRNLTYINDSRSPKVYRWRLAIQEYSFDLEYLARPENFVSDSFSPIVPRNEAEAAEYAAKEAAKEASSASPVEHLATVHEESVDGITASIPWRGQRTRPLPDNYK